MIDWVQVFSNGIWLAGLALLMATLSFGDYTRRSLHLPAKQAWRAILGSRWACIGTLLFCIGMGLTGGSWIEGGLWGLLGLYAASGLPRSWHLWPRPVGAIQVAAKESRPGARPSPVIVVAEWITKTEFLWLALAAPFFLFPAPDRVLPLIVLPALWIARRIARGHFAPPTPLDWAIALMLLMVLVSMYATFDLSFSLGKIAGVLLGVGVFYALVGWASSSRHVAWAVAAYVLFGFPLAIMGLLGINWTNKLPALSQLSAHLPSIVKGLPGAESGLQPNEVGGALVWIVPLQLSLLGWSLARKSASRTARWLLPLGLLLLTAICGGTLVLTQSRSALIGFALGMGLLLWLGVPKARFVFVLLVVLAAAAVVYVGPQNIADKLVDGVGMGASPTEGITSLQDRTEIWSRAIYGIEDFPFTGMGMNAFRRVMPILYPMFSVAPETDLAHAHNELLQAALDLGLPGLIAYMAIMLLATALLVQTWRSATEGWVRAAVAGVASGLLAHSVYGITDAIALGAKPGVLLWWLLGLTVVLWQRSAAHDTPIRADHEAQERQEGQERDEMQLATASAGGQER